jgi:hypothetical protein
MLCSDFQLDHDRGEEIWQGEPLLIPSRRTTIETSKTQSGGTNHVSPTHERRPFSGVHRSLHTSARHRSQTYPEKYGHETPSHIITNSDVRRTPSGINNSLDIAAQLQNTNLGLATLPN